MNPIFARVSAEFQTEVENDVVLRFFGMILSLLHVLTAWFWWQRTFIKPESIICHSWFPHCESFAFWLNNQKIWLSPFWVFVSLLSLFFFFRKKVLEAWIYLALSFLIKICFHFSAYQMMGNYHYILNFVTLAFLFFPQRKEVLRILVVLIYLGSGILRFNTDWLSGATVPERFFVGGKWLEVGLVAVIFLELLGSWFLLARNPILRLLTVGLFLTFHFFSWSAVGYFFPLIMMGLLTVFIFPWTPVRFPTLFRGQFFLGLFVVFQVVPFVAEPRSHLNSRGRAFALNMFDARTVCATQFFIRYQEKVVEYNPKFDSLAPRIWCDPIVVVHKLNQTCERLRLEPGFVDIDLSHQMRRQSGTEIEALRLTNVCSKPIFVDWWGRVVQKASVL